jgi:hypothetical protein
MIYTVDTEMNFSLFSDEDLLEELGHTNLDEDQRAVRMKQMKYFFTLEKAHKIATIILAIREKLELQGDFSALENLLRLVG